MGGFFQGVGGGSHAQSGLTQPQCLRPPSGALVRYGVAFSPDT